MSRFQPLRAVADLFPTNMPWRVIGFGYLITLSSALGQTHFLALFTPSLRAEFNLSHGEIGTIYAIATIFSSIVLVLVGKLIDNVDVRYFTFAVTVGLAVSCLAISFAGSVFMLTLAFFLQRLFGQGLSSHTAITVTARLAMTNRGKSLSMVQLGFATGEAIAPALITSLLIFLSWRSLWVGAFVFQLFIIAPLAQLILRKLDNHPPLRNKDRGDLPDFAVSWSQIQVLADSRFWKIIPVIFTPPFFITTLLLHQGSLAESLGIEFSSWALGFTAFPICAGVLSLFGGELADKNGCRYPLMLSTPLILLGMSILLIPYFSGQQYVYYAIMGCGVGLWAPGFNSLWREIYGSVHLGANLAMANSMAILFSAASPLLIGIFLDIGLNWNTILVLFLVTISIGYCSFLSTQLTALAPPKKRVPSLASRIR